MGKKIDTIPKGLIPRLAKAEIKACENVTTDGLKRLRQQDAERAKAARAGRN